MTEDIFDMSNMRIFKEIEKKKKKTGGVYTSICLLSAELSKASDSVFWVRGKAFGLRNLSYSKISVVMLLGYRITRISRKLESERKINAQRPNAAYLNS